MKLLIIIFLLSALSRMCKCQTDLQYISERLTFVTDSLKKPFRYQQLYEKFAFDSDGRILVHTFFDHAGEKEEEVLFIYLGENKKPLYAINTMTNDTLNSSQYDFRSLGLSLVIGQDTAYCHESNTRCLIKENLIYSKQILLPSSRLDREFTYVYKYNERKKKNGRRWKK